MYTYVVQTCDTMRETFSAPWDDEYTAYWCDHTDDVPEGIILNVQPTPPPDEPYDDLPF
jgi:hypothetical protein